MSPVPGAFLFKNQPGDPNTDPDPTQANYTFERNQRVCAGSLGTPYLFTPSVMAEIVLPDNQKYKFEYNEYGEITKITYPTGGYERFEYGEVPALGYNAAEVYSQANRGVKKREVSFDGATVSQTWIYDSDGSTITITAPDGSKTTRTLHVSTGSSYGFENPLAGMPIDEQTKDVNGQLRSRTLTEYTATPPIGLSLPTSDTLPFPTSTRDARPLRQISIIFENNQALATMSETEYENPADSSPVADPRYFARLNAKQTKSYHFLPIADQPKAQNGSISAIKELFNTSGQVAGISQTDYMYSADYLARGIIGLPIRTQSLDPAHTTEIIAKSQISYDEANQDYSLSDTTTTTGHTTPTEAFASLRGNATTVQTWIKESDTWLATHTQYDNFGNPIKNWDAKGNTSTVQYDPRYKYAYPTTVTSPTPDDGTHGSNQAFSTSTNYDFNTGLPTSTTDANNLTIQTKYTDPTTGAMDPLLRVRQIIAPNGQQTITEYGAPDSDGHFPVERRFVKVKTQFDTNVWKEGYTWFDGLGRTVKTQSVETDGDVFVETKYDKMGRSIMTTNPYRAGKPVLWNLTEYDAAGRVEQSRAPVADQNPDNPTGDILGTTSYAISTAQDLVGTVVTAKDAAGRRSRSITNALGQLLRVDEATGINGINEDADLGSLAAPSQSTAYKYNALGKMTEVTQGDQKRYFRYDWFGRLVRVRQPEQQINPNLNTTNNPGNDSWTAAFEYDVLGNVKTAVDAKGVKTITDYDNLSRVKTRCYTKPNQAAAVTSCSSLSASDADPNTPPVDYYYDGIYWDVNSAKQTAVGAAKGALTQVKSSISQSQTTNFDAFGRALTYQQVTDGQVYATTYQYNLSGALVSETYPSTRVVKNDFDANGDLARVASRASRLAAERTYASGFAYTAAGAIERLQLGNGRWEAAKFNDRLQVIELGLGTSATNPNLWQVGYEYGEFDSSGNLVTAKNTGNIARQTVSFEGLTQPFVQTYKYDALNRLAEARETAGAGGAQTWQQVFKYDRYGNRERTGSSKQMGNTNSPLEAQNNLTFPTVDANTTTNKFSTGQGYTYDANGNIIVDPVDGGRSFAFNGDNKQTEVRDAYNNLVGKYYYDGDGKRVKKELYSGGNNTNPTETTVFVYSGGKLIAEYSTTPPQNPTTSYTTTDHLGSPRVITDTSGTGTSRRDFMPFGEELYPDSQYRKSSDKYGVIDSVRQRFTGYEKDEETKLDFAEARYYNNSHGRFTAVDPLLASGKSANPQTFNRYTYVSNNPIILTDPTGLFGDYYSRGGKWLGTDGKRDGEVYFADYLSNDGQGNVDVTNIKKTTSLAVLHIQNWYTRSVPGRAPSFLDSFPDDPFGEAASGTGKGLGNFAIDTANTATTLALFANHGPAGAVFAATDINPFAIGRFSLDTPIERNFGMGTYGAAMLAPGVIGGVFSGGASALSVVPEV